MSKKPSRKSLATLLAGAMLVAVVPVVSASHNDGGSYGGDRPSKAVSYINPDTGAATANPDVNPSSNCFTPDRSDTQKLSDPGAANRNVHNDACFFGYRDRTKKLDAPASLQSTGVGVISACPDPDGAGPKVAILSADRELCFQSGYQERGIAGDQEFHARMNNDSTPGSQSVTWCYDSNRNGCSDERVKDRIAINWVR